ncbi:hypothetical protein G7Z17_g12913 [Cylindrodendrum hubeiense]|uniref:Uncharacterized protein n=1 Tax=Cylindrodendrum hubeiense TaxID=595255 RepID=A0A9P5GWT5_9HYPO|nr:hypothetical protein G7Z17_g12913 [Cylindrodendrum hubeiense]
MARPLIHSFFLASLLSSLAVASPCQGSSSTGALSTTATTPTGSETTPNASFTTPTAPTTPTTEGTSTPTPTDTNVCNYPWPACGSPDTCDALVQIRDSNVDPIINGNFESGSLCPWVLSEANEACAYVASDGADGTDRTFRAPDMKCNRYLEVYQDISSYPNTYVSCSYQWYWDKYYDSDGYVPYLRIWNGDLRIGNRYPTGPGQTGTWMSGNFDFWTDSNGEARIWITAQSPQEDGDNWFAIDEISCYADAPPDVPSASSTTASSTPAEPTPTPVEITPVQPDRAFF